MKKRIALILSFLTIAMLLFACGTEEKGVVDAFYRPQEEAPPAKQWSSNLLSTGNSAYAIDFRIDGQRLEVSGEFADDTNGAVMVIFNKSDDEKYTTVVKERKFSASMDFPDCDRVAIDIFVGPEQYGTYKSIILDFVAAEKVSGTWRFVKSPVYDNNERVFNMSKDPADYLSPDDRVQSDDEEIVRLANSITAGIDDDYSKVLAIHDWVAGNIYYDFDALKIGDYEGLDATSVLRKKRGVCEGYANIFAALVRSQNIPCRIQGGFALGISTARKWDAVSVNEETSNHAWNEVYIDGRWIIIDATWDSDNKYENGAYMDGPYVTHTYFDTTLEFLSLSHKIIDE